MCLTISGFLLFANVSFMYPLGNKGVKPSHNPNRRVASFSIRTQGPSNLVQERGPLN